MAGCSSIKTGVCLCRAWCFVHQATIKNFPFTVGKTLEIEARQGEPKIGQGRWSQVLLGTNDFECKWMLIGCELDANGMFIGMVLKLASGEVH